jgi:hypothetical protein
VLTGLLLISFPLFRILFDEHRFPHKATAASGFIDEAAAAHPE